MTLGQLEGNDDVAGAVAILAGAGLLRLPLPGGGRTSERFRLLGEIAAVDLSLARLAEGHADALAILEELRASPRTGTYGVWAADAAEAPLRAERGRGGWQLRGRKRYASGAGRLDRALVTARSVDGGRLFDVDLASPGLTVVRDTWRAVGMEATASGDVIFDGAAVSEDDAVGGPDAYLSRPGFWHGAIGVAACWYGGALGAFRMLRARLGAGASDHQAAHLGAVAAACETMRASLDGAALAIDHDPRDREGGARTRALVVRHVVEQGCQEVLTRVGRASGPGPLVFDRAHARRAADLVVYLRQHHAERDLAELGRRILAGEP